MGQHHRRHRPLPQKTRRRVFGLTLPLITKADGTKFGKTESGAVWLDPKRTSVYQFYQFWINADDRDVIRYLKFFTFLTQEEIAALEAAHAANPGAREAHHALAKAVTAIIHGEAACAEAVRATDILFGGSLDGLTAADARHPPQRSSHARRSPPATSPPAFALTEALVASTLSPSKGQARKDIDGGGIYINGQRCQDNTRVLTTADLLHGRAVCCEKAKSLRPRRPRVSRVAAVMYLFWSKSYAPHAVSCHCRHRRFRRRSSNLPELSSAA